MTTGDDDMNEELEAAAHEATTDKAEAWAKFTAACAAWCRDVLHSPEDHRALADAACAYAGKRVERHVAEEREQCLAIAEAHRREDKPWSLGDVIDAIRARGAKAGETPTTNARLIAAAPTLLAERDALLKERDAARAEVERLKCAYESDKAKAANAFMDAECARLETERDGLAAALRKIADETSDYLTVVARDALANWGGGA